MARQPTLRHLVLPCSAIEQGLRDAGISLPLMEVKSQVMHKLQRTGFLHHFGGRIFLTHYQAVAALTTEVLVTR